MGFGQGRVAGWAARGLARVRRGLAAAAILAAGGIPAMAGGPETVGQQPAPVFFRIGTGATGGTYYPVAATVAHVISAPPGSRPCEAGGPCGVPGLVAAAVATAGSVENIARIEDGRLESAFVQGDVAAWAHAGRWAWQGRAARSLRAIAALYPEAVQIVTRAGSGIERLDDLRGRRVSLDMPGSGTLLEARLILSAAGLDASDIQIHHLSLDQAVAALEADEIDAFFLVAGYPATAVAELSHRVPLNLVALDAALVARITAADPCFSAASIPADTYDGQAAPVPSLAVRAQWVTSADQPEALIHDIAAALWSPRTLDTLENGDTRGQRILLQDALDVTVPLHPGAARFYRERGLLH